MKKNTLFRAAFLAICTTAFLSCKEEQKQEKQETHEMHGSNETADASEYAEMVNDGTIKTDTMKGSPERYSMVLLDKTHLHIAYFSPGVKERVIWGGLVPYGKVWVSGAHHATTLEINHAVKIQDKVVPPGKYAFFTIPGKEKWIVILNKNADQHLTDEYEEKLDVARFEVIPQSVEQSVPRLTYKVATTGQTEGTVTLEWEKLKIALPFSQE